MNEQQIQNETAVVKYSSASPGSFFDAGNFEHLQRLAKMFCKSELVPKNFQGESNLSNVVIALEMAQRLGAAAMAVMQQIYIVYGKPGWSSQFIIACLNTCGRFEPLRFEVEGAGEARQCTAWTVPRGFRIPENVRTLTQARDADLPLFEGPPCSIGMARAEGWIDKNGSKWKTMPELMLRYRAATFFGRLNAPELLMGMASVEEIHDEPIDVTPARTIGRAKAIVAATSPLIETRGEAEPAKAAAPANPEPPKIDTSTIQGALAAALDSAGVTFDEFRSWCVMSGFWRDADSIALFAEVPEDKCQELKANPKHIANIIKIHGKKAGAK